MALVMCAVGRGGDSGCANLHCLLQEDTPHWTRWSREQSVIFTFSRSAVMMVINCSRRTVIKLQIQQSGVRLLIAEKGWKFISFALFNGGSICNFQAFVFLNRARIYLFIYCLFLCRIIALSELHSLPKVICIIKQTLPPPSPSFQHKPNPNNLKPIIAKPALDYGYLVVPTSQEILSKSMDANRQILDTTDETHNKSELLIYSMTSHDSSGKCPQMTANLLNPNKFSQALRQSWSRYSEMSQVFSLICKHLFE